MIINMVLERKVGIIIKSDILDNFSKGKNLGPENLNSKGDIMKENFWMDSSMAQGNIILLILVNFMRVNL